MTLRSATAVRLWGAAVAAVLLLPVPALAAGTGGIEVTPVPPVRDGKQATSFRVDVPSSGREQVPFTVRNVEDGERSARVYAAAVTRAADGTLSLGNPGSSRWVSLAAEEVTLAAGEVQERSFTVNGGDLPDGQVLAAVVVEVRNGSVVQRASTLVRLERGRTVPLPLLVVVAAVLLLAFAGAGVALLGRRRQARSQA